MKRITAYVLAAVTTFAPAVARSDVLVAPKVKTESAPPYPSGESGDATVVVELVIDASGHVTAAKIKTSASEAFDQSALAAAKDLLFAPATRDGAPIPAKIQFSFHFTAPSPPTPSPSPSPSPISSPPPVPAPTEAIPVVELEVVGESPPREVTHHTLSGESMRKMPGTNNDPLRAIEAMPGVGKPPGISDLLIVRGGAPQDTSIFIDGVWVPYAYHFGGITSIIPGDVLEKIDFYPGNFGPQYGRAIGGVVDLGVRSPRKDRFGGLLQVDLLDGRVMLEGPLSKSTRVLVAARRSWVDLWLGPVLRSGGTGVVTAPVYQDAQLVVEHDLTDSTTLRFAAFGSQDALSLVLDSPQASDPTNGGAVAARQGFVRFQLRSQTKLAGGATWTNMISWGPNWERFNVGEIKVDDDFRVTHARSDLRVKIADGVHAVAGLDLLNIWGDITLKVPPLPPAGSAEESPIFGRPLRELHARGTFWWPGAYAMLDLQPGAGIRLLPGVRADYSEDSNRWTVDPRIAMRWSVGEGTTLKGGIGMYHQQPQPNESIAPFGTPNLRNPLAIQTSIGVEQKIGSGFDLSIEGFHKQLRDLVIARAAESSTASGTTYDNSGSGRAYGLELLLKGHHGRFSGWVAYTLSRSERRDAPGEPLRVFQYDQTHVLSALASVNLGAGWTAGGRFRYVTGLPSTPYVGGLVDLDSGSYAPVQGARDSTRISSFHALDLRIEKQWTFTDWRLAAYLDVRNVYNRKNSEGTVYRYDYAESQAASGIPILPVIGVRGEL